MYVVFDVLSEAKIGHGGLTGPLAHAHTLVDHVLPIFVGALLGVCAHYFRIRARLAAAQEAVDRGEALRSRLQRVERDQAVWVLAAAVLHELNNPLHAIGLLLDELGTCQDDAEHNADLVARARAQAERALGHLRTLRSMRTSEEPVFRRVALDRMLAVLARDVQVLAEDQGLVVSLDCRGAVEATADPEYVRTILENVIDNSLHSLQSRPGGGIRIRLDVEGGRAVVRVSDDGPAIEAELRANVFEPLRSSKTHGLGLGLPIARALARAMRGDLCLEEGAGKEFRLELPLPDAP